ncbi:MAG: YbaN family protein [Ignavibacteria bacterium]
MTTNTSDQEKSKVKISDKPYVRALLTAGGFLFVGIGVLGMFLPLLPTTIFFLLAAWCFARSSEKFHYWLHHNKLFGKYLTNYSINKGMTLGSKIFSISFLWAGILVSVIFATNLIYIRILLIAIAIGVSWHILAIKTLKEYK